MKEKRRKKGNHTWDTFLSYHRCKKCGYIMENRDPYQYRMMREEKEIKCVRCSHVFTATNPAKFHLGPLFGEGASAEVDWGSER